MIQQTTLTRIGLFNQSERAELLNLFIPNPDLPTGIDFIDVTPKQCLLIHQYLKTLVTISTNATRSLIKLRNETLYKNTKYVNLQPQNKKTVNSRNRYTALDPIEQELPEPRIYRIQYDFPPQELHFSSTSALPPQQILNNIREEMNGQQGSLFKLSTFSGNQLLEPYCDDERKAVVWPDKNWTDPPSYSPPTLTKKGEIKVRIPHKSGSLKITEELGKRISDGPTMSKILPLLATIALELSTTLEDPNEIKLAEDFLNLYKLCYSHIKNFLDYITYLNWHLQTEVDQVMIDFMHLWADRTDSLTSETYHNLIAIRDSIEETTSTGTATGIEIILRLTNSKKRERNQKKTLKKPLRTTAMIEQFQMNPILRDPTNDSLILPLEIPTKFRFNTITTNPEYLTQQEQLIQELRTRLQHMLNVEDATSTTLPITEHGNQNQLPQLKQELLDLRDQLIHSNQLNSTHLFNLVNKLKTMIHRINNKIISTLKWQNKHIKPQHQSTNGQLQQQLISTFFKPNDNNISEVQTEITARESTQTQTQAFNSND